jgi:hypothetical protein
MQFTILGAGMSGLLASRSLYPNIAGIFEKQGSLPNNHHAVLRFRTDSVSKATGIPFKKVKVIKAIWGGKNPIWDATQYSFKVTGKIQPRSILDTQMVERYIAPPDFVERLAEGANIIFNCGVDQPMLEALPRPIVSTLPMHLLANMVGGDPGFEPKYMKGWTYKQTLEKGTDLYATMYYPGLDVSCYRASVTGNELMVEGMGEVPTDLQMDYILNIVEESMGLQSVMDTDRGEVYSSLYQKISEPTPEEAAAARRHVLWLTEKHGIYSLGRFALWRPKILMDDVLQDVQVIRQLAQSGQYARKIKAMK